MRLDDDGLLRVKRGVADLRTYYPVRRHEVGLNSVFLPAAVSGDKPV